MLDSHRLEVFAEVAQRRSFSAAGDHLGLTQSGVSRQIAALEAELGQQLLERSARRVELTQAGRLLLSHAEAVLGRLTIAERELEALAAGQTGSLRLAAHPSASVWLMPRAIGELSRKRPLAELSLLESDSSESPRAIRAGEFDLAVVSVAAPEANRDWDDLTHHHLLEDEWCLLLPADHRLARARKLRIADLADQTIIDSNVTAGPVRDLCGRAGFEPRVRFRCEEWLGRQGLVAAGVGIALIPRLAVAAVRDDLVVRPLGGVIESRGVYAIHHQAADGDPLMSAMVGELRDAAAMF